MDGHMEEKLREKLKNSKGFFAAFTAAFVCIYILTDPTLSSMYFLYFTYRMQTMVILFNYVILAGTYILFCVFLYRRARSERKLPDCGMIGCYLLVFSGYLVATLANPATGSMARWTDTLMYSIIPILLAVMFLSTEEGKHYYISVVTLIYLSMLALNLLFWFFPQLYIGEAKEWREPFFLGFDNKAGWSMLMGAFFALLNWKVNGRRWTAVIYFVLLLINIRIIWCITALMGTVVYLGYLVVPFVRKWFRKWDFLFFSGIIVVIFLCFMFFQKYTVSSEPVALFIEEVLQKKRSMSGRLPLWQLGVSIVMQKPWLGVGMQLKPGFIHMADEYGVWSYYHAHNELLQIWYEGGLVTLLLALLSLVYLAKVFRDCKTGKLPEICKLALFVLLFMLLSDNMPYYPWYMVSFLANTAIFVCRQEQKNVAPDDRQISVTGEEMI